MFQMSQMSRQLLDEPSADLKSHNLIQKLSERDLQQCLHPQKTVTTFLMLTASLNMSQNNFERVLTNSSEKRWKGWRSFYSFFITFSVPQYLLPFQRERATPCGFRSVSPHRNSLIVHPQTVWLVNTKFDRWYASQPGVPMNESKRYLFCYQFWFHM